MNTRSICIHRMLLIITQESMCAMGGHNPAVSPQAEKCSAHNYADKRAVLIISRHVVTSRQVFSIQTSRLADIFIETLKWVRNDDRTVGATIEQFAGREATTPFLEDRCPLVHRCRGRGKCEVK